MLSKDIERKDYLAIIKEELKRIEFITNEFLVLSKPQSIVFKEKNIFSILKNLKSLLDSEAILHNVIIVLECNSDIPNVLCDEDQIKQVFLNIIKNGIESMYNGGYLNIQCKKTAANNVVITVEDQGCGIENDRLQSIGEPFYSTKEKGTGLGLMISFKIIREHRGDIMITSELNTGTTVEISLPGVNG